MLRPSPWASIAARRCRPKGLWVRRRRPEDVREGLRHRNGRWRDRLAALIPGLKRTP